MRLHGDTELYASGYSDRTLARWAERVRAWSKGAQPRDAKLIAPGRAPSRQPRDVYCYFDNDAKVHAPFDAVNLSRHLGLVLPGVPGEPLPESASPREARQSTARRTGLRHRIAVAA
jgi:uncharacterized protein YecE (DUF72 family)